MNVYYEHGGIRIYHGDCREILPELVDAASTTGVVTDPPYGIGRKVHERKGLKQGKAWAASADYEVPWDDERPSDATMAAVMRAGRQVIIWGGNHLGLPAQSQWLVWDKRTGDNKYADAELAWTNLGGAVRLKSHKWQGMIQEYGAGTARDKEKRVHPTQKPVPVMRWCIEMTDTPLILDPFMGSGSILRAAKDAGRQAVGIEISEAYCEVAAKRLAQAVFDFEGELGWPR